MYSCIYTHEYSGDYNELIYLRARYYAPGMGRFLTKDPSGMEANLYRYAGANPINRIDPTGLFSRDQVAKSFEFSKFSDVLNYYDTHGEHWGFVATLLRALPGDYIISGQYRIEPFTKPYKRGKAFYVGYDDSQGITLNGRPLRATFASNSSENPTKGQLGTAPWRSSDAIYYTVKDDLHSGYERYVDSPLTTDIPDFWAVSGSFFYLQGMYIVDRFGHKYFTPGPTYGTSDVGAAYVEGYVGAALPKLPARMEHYLPERELFQQLIGLGYCFGAEASFMIGTAGTFCMNFTYIGMYSLGVQINAGANFAPYTYDLGQNSSIGWDSILRDMENGINRQGLTTLWPNYDDGCDTRFPHLLPYRLSVGGNN